MVQRRHGGQHSLVHLYKRVFPQGVSTLTLALNGQAISEEKVFEIVGNGWIDGWMLHNGYTKSSHHEP